MNTPGPAPFTLASRRLGAVPLVAHFARRIGLPGLLDRWVPPDDARLALDPATVLAIVVANLCIEHRPLYALGEWAAAFEPALLGLAAGQAGLLNDDRAGRMLDRLFLADRGSLLTELMTGVIGKFGIDCSRLHNDSTSVSVHGAYQGADGGEVAGTPTAAITLGHSKDHRPDLKQLVYILTVSGDHAVPVIYRLADGNTSDDPTHIPDLGPAGEADRARRFPLCRGLQAGLCGRDAAHRPRRRPVHHGAAAQPQGGRCVPGLDARPSAGLGRGGPRAGRPARRPGPGVVSLRGARAVGGGVPDRVGARQRQAAA